MTVFSRSSLARATAIALVGAAVLAVPAARAGTDPSPIDAGCAWVRMPDGTYVRICNDNSISMAGATCGFTSTDDGGNGILQPNQQFGEIHGGPVAVAALGDLTANPASATFICSVNVNTDSYTAAHAASASSAGVASLGNPSATYLAPTPFSYIAAPGSNVYLCTELIVGDAAGHGEHLYYDYTPDPTDPSGQTSLGFTTSSTAKCGLTISVD